MFKPIRKNYVSADATVNGLYRIVDVNGLLTHYIALLSMQLEGKERSVLAEFYPQQNRKLSEMLGVDPIQQTVVTNNPTRILEVSVELQNVRKPRFSEICTAELIDAKLKQFIPLPEESLTCAKRYFAR